MITRDSGMSHAGKGAHRLIRFENYYGIIRVILFYFMSTFIVS